jgi:hypothetical protein
LRRILALTRDLTTGKHSRGQAGNSKVLNPKSWKRNLAGTERGMVQKQVTSPGGSGRCPEGDAPRSEACALGARWLLPARPQPPSSCHPRVSDFEPCPDRLRTFDRWPRFAVFFMSTFDHSKPRFAHLDPVRTTHSTEISGSQSFTARDQLSTSMILYAI